MRHAVIIAGGSGTRLWPMSRKQTPKQLIPFIDGQSLLQISAERLHSLVDQDRLHVCAGLDHQRQIVEALPGMTDAQFLGEPMGRDTLNAVGFAAAVLAKRDPEAVIAVFTADHLIEPVDRFRAIVERGFELVEQRAETLVTFGIAPTHAATGFGYLQLGDPIGDGGARVVDEFREKPDADTAASYFQAGPERYLWNSGMFVWRAATLLDCIRRFAPENAAGLDEIAAAWDGPDQEAVLRRVYPTLKKISVDFAVMEPASRDPGVTVAAVPMPLTWLDVGSWPAFAKTREPDDRGNAVAAAKPLLLESDNTLVASSDPGHVIAAVGCTDLLIVHTPEATLVCRADQAEQIKKVHQLVGEAFGQDYV